jgi:hypothetical protein
MQVPIKKTPNEARSLAQRSRLTKHSRLTIQSSYSRKSQNAPLPDAAEAEKIIDSALAQTAHEEDQRQKIINLVQ